MNNNNIDMNVNKLQLKIIDGTRQIPHIENEHQTRTLLIDPKLRILGYDTENIKIVTEEHRLKNGKQIDYGIYLNNELKIIIEAKNISEKLDKYIEQLKEYVEFVGAKIGILTNGIEYQFFGVDENEKMSVYPFKIIKDISKLTKEEIKEIAEKYNYEEVSNNIYYITKIIQLELENQKLKREKETNSQTTFKINKEKTIDELYEELINQISKMENIEIKHDKHYTPIYKKDTNTIIGSIQKPYKTKVNVHMYIEKDDDEEKLTRCLEGRGINGKGNHEFEVRTEKDINYAMLLINKVYNKPKETIESLVKKEKEFGKQRRKK